MQIDANISQNSKTPLSSLIGAAFVVLDKDNNEINCPNFLVLAQINNMRPNASILKMGASMTHDLNNVKFFSFFVSSDPVFRKTVKFILVR